MGPFGIMGPSATGPFQPRYGFPRSVDLSDFKITVKALACWLLFRLCRAGRRPESFPISISPEGPQRGPSYN